MDVVAHEHVGIEGVMIAVLIYGEELDESLIVRGVFEFWSKRIPRSLPRGERANTINYSTLRIEIPRSLLRGASISFASGSRRDDVIERPLELYSRLSRHGATISEGMNKCQYSNFQV